MLVHVDFAPHFENLRGTALQTASGTELIVRMFCVMSSPTVPSPRVAA